MTPEEWQTAMFANLTDSQAKTHDALTKSQQAERDSLRFWLTANPYPTGSTTTPPPTTTEPPPTTTTPPPTTTTPSGTRLFNGDYSTGDYSQWGAVQNKEYNGSGAGWPATGKYEAQIINDPAKGKCSRWEVRDGDKPTWSEGERSQVQAGNNTGGIEGQIRWYQIGLKFDSTFQKDFASMGWGIVSSWHPNSPTGSGPLQWSVGTKNGYLCLIANRQSSPGVYLNAPTIWEMPLDDVWHMFKMRILWSADDNKGSVQLWHNGTKQTLKNGSQEYKVRTIVPGTSGGYYKEGLYRYINVSRTSILYTTGFRCATEEAAL